MEFFPEKGKCIREGLGWLVVAGGAPLLLDMMKLSHEHSINLWASVPLAVLGLSTWRNCPKTPVLKMEAMTLIINDDSIPKGRRLRVEEIVEVVRRGRRLYLLKLANGKTRGLNLGALSEDDAIRADEQLKALFRYSEDRGADL